MSFLWPGAWFLAALALPVIAFYLIRTRLERRRTSTLLFWNQIEPSLYNRTLWRRLRRWLSLALQLLFLGLLLMALSRPLTRWQSKKPRSLILVLDVSASLAATDVKPSRWQRALDIAREQIAQMGPFDQTTVIAAEATPRLLSPWSRNKRALHRALQSAHPQNQEADISNALVLARNLAASQEAASIHLISDKTWSKTPAPELMQAVTTLHPIAPANPVNAGITLFTARRSSAVPGVYHLVARAVATGPLHAELELRRNGALLDLQKIDFDGVTPWEKSWEGHAPEEVAFEATLRLLPATDAPAGNTAPHDSLSADNSARARLKAVQPVAVALHAPPHAFLDAALEALPLVQIERYWPPKADDTHPSPRDGRTRLHLFHRVAPPAGFESEAVVLIDPPGEGFWGRENGVLEQPLVSDFARESPLLRFVSLETLRLGKAREIVPATGAELFAESFGKPLLFGHWPARSGSTPRWLAFSFGLEESDLVFRTAFPILLGNILQSLQETSIQSSALLPGETQSLLKPATLAQEEEEGALKEESTPSWVLSRRWAAYPLWWWIVAAGVLWLLGEWGLYTRRITE